MPRSNATVLPYSLLQKLPNFTRRANPALPSILINKVVLEQGTVYSFTRYQWPVCITTELSSYKETTWPTSGPSPTFTLHPTYSLRKTEGNQKVTSEDSLHQVCLLPALIPRCSAFYLIFYGETVHNLLSAKLLLVH